MLLNTYEISKSKKEHVYKFLSEGPKGKIKKLIKFSIIDIIEAGSVYNLGFGDEIPQTDEIDYITRTDNTRNRCKSCYSIFGKERIKLGFCYWFN